MISDISPDMMERNRQCCFSLLGFYGGRGLTAQRNNVPRRINYSTAPADFSGYVIVAYASLSLSRARVSLSLSLSRESLPLCLAYSAAPIS